MSADKSSLDLTIGPLRYRIVAHDGWGREALCRIRDNLECLPFAGAPDRVIHALEYDPTVEERWEIKARRLPGPLANLLPSGIPSGAWKHPGDRTGCTYFFHADSTESLWTHSPMFADYEASFQIPWHPILEDIVRLRGGVFHGGLATLDGRGYLFTAPPGGGKSTALSRIPPPWQTLSDDGALVWPGTDGGFLASPLPTWSVVLGVNEAMPRIQRWVVGTSLPVGGAIVLEKARAERLVPLKPIEAAQHFYRALSEHPRVVRERDPFRRQFFHAACELARTVPAWRLELTRTGDFWSLLNLGVSETEHTNR